MSEKYVLDRFMTAEQTELQDGADYLFEGLNAVLTHETLREDVALEFGGNQLDF